MKAVGIDLGTTNTVVVALGKGGPKILHNKEGEEYTRSVVTNFEGELLVGSPAENYWPLAPEDTITSIKRLMGRAITDKEVVEIIGKEEFCYKIVEPTEGTKDSLRVVIGRTEYSAGDISAMILKKAKEDAEQVLGEEVTHAVITVPAYFSDKQKYATREAGRKAGLTVMKLIEEPTAAAMAYSLEAEGEGAKSILVFDLGGGTFDISVLMMTAGTFAPLNLEGDMWLGGDNFDQLIMNYILDQVKDKHGVDLRKDKSFMAKLKLEARRAKETLSSAQSAPIFIVPAFQKENGEMVNVQEKITREQFENMAAPLVEKVNNLVQKAVEGAGMTVEDIDYVLVVGGSTAVPMIKQAIEMPFGKEKILHNIHPKNSVAIGAAIMAGIFGYIECEACKQQNDLEAVVCSNSECQKPLQGIEPKRNCPRCNHENSMDNTECEECHEPLIESPKENPAPFHYGIQTTGDKFNIFIQKNEHYPKPESEIEYQTFQTLHNEQRIISLPVYGGENLEKASENDKQGEAFAVLPPRCSKGTKILVKLWLNSDGIFELTARMETGQELKPWILRGEQDQRAKDRIMKILDRLDKNADNLNLEEKEKVFEHQEQMLDDFNRGNYDDAEAKVQKVESVLDNKKDPSPKGKRFEATSQYAKFLIDRYGWLMGSSVVDQLNGLLQKGQQSTDEVERDQAANELEKKISEVMQSNQVLKVLFEAFIAINSIIKPQDPITATELLQELEEIENALKNRDPDAVEKLRSHLDRVGKIIDEILVIKCSECGHDNNREKMGEQGWKCAKCGYDFSMLAGISTDSDFHT